jgi:hypothetical protein
MELKKAQEYINGAQVSTTLGALKRIEYRGEENYLPNNMFILATLRTEKKKVWGYIRILLENLSTKVNSRMIYQKVKEF